MDNIVNALYALFGREETPGDRAFRHEREGIIVPLFFQGLSSLCLVLVVVLLFGPLSLAIQVGIYGLAFFILVLFLLNLALKWQQNKNGGD